MAHRRARKSDFQGKTIERFDNRADNIWRFYFTDGTSVAVETEDFYMVVCDECLPSPKPKGRVSRPAP
jgi:hypothetical protein